MQVKLANNQEIELLHFIFERELKPPFSKGKKDNHDRHPYYNRDGEKIGALARSCGWWLTRSRGGFYVDFNISFSNIGPKVRSAFGFDHDNIYWWTATNPHLKSWIEDQIDVKLNYIILS